MVLEMSPPPRTLIAIELDETQNLRVDAVLLRLNDTRAANRLERGAHTSPHVWVLWGTWEGLEGRVADMVSGLPSHREETYSVLPPHINLKKSPMLNGRSRNDPVGQEWVRAYLHLWEQ